MITVILGCMVISVICVSIQRLNLSAAWTLIFSVFASVLGYGISLIVFRNRVVLNFVYKMYSHIM